MSFRFFRVGPSMQPSEVALSLQSICALIWLLEWNLRKVELHVLMRESKENDHRTTDHRDSCTLKPGRNESLFLTYVKRAEVFFWGESCQMSLFSKREKPGFPTDGWLPSLRLRHQRSSSLPLPFALSNTPGLRQAPW